MGEQETQKQGLTCLGKAVIAVVVLGLIGGGVFLAWRSRNQPQPDTKASGKPDSAGAFGFSNVKFDTQELVEAKPSAPALGAPAAYVPKDNTLDLELSEYAGYAGLIAANGGLEPNENSFFFKQYGFKARIKISEAESWEALNSGRMAASATTADVLAVFGRQFNVIVPAQIGFSRGADGVVVRTDIRRVNALKGQTLAAAQFTEADFFIRCLAQEAGLEVAMLPNLDAKPDPEKLNLVYTKDGLAAGDLFLKAIKARSSRLAGCVTWAPKTTEVAEESGGAAHLLVTNRNLLIVADVLIVNRGFAEQNPKQVAGLVHGLLEGNRLVRENPDAHLAVLGKAFKWDRAKTQAELAKVHLSNLPENLAFFSGAIDMAGSFGSIYQMSVLSYGSELIRNPVGPDRFMDPQHLKSLEGQGLYKDQKVAIAPIRGAKAAGLENDPLLSKDIRFFFEANSSNLDMKNAENPKLLASIKQLLQVSPGSTVLLRGHVDNSKAPEFKRQGEDVYRSQALRAMALSQERANEIKKHLAAIGLDTKRIDTVGRGWEEPAGADMDKNRRVEAQWFTLE